MDEIDKLFTSKINNYKYGKVKEKIKNRNEKLFFITVALFSIFIFLLIILLILHVKYSKNIENNSINSKNVISINYLNEIYSPKIVYNAQYNNYENSTKNLIHISYSLDNKLVYPTFISMLSGLENCNKDNLIVYHLLLSHSFNTTDIEIFESLKDKYEVKINYYIIPNIFGFARRWTDNTDCVYYKILIPFMFPDYERMIYLDGDTLIRKDILEMFTYPFYNNYILGFPFYMGYVMGKYGIKKPEHYINGGCLLFNIKKIIKDHKDIDLLSLTIKNNSKWLFREQDSINYAFYPKIGFLPLKYGIYMIGSKYAFKALASHVYSPLNSTEAEEAIKDPSIVHFSCCWPKIWTNGTKNLFKDKDICLRYQKEFYFYAKKSKYYQIIKDTYFNKQRHKHRKKI